MSRDTRTAYRRRATDMGHTVDEAVAAIKAEGDARYETARAVHANAEAERVRFTADELKDATHVRTRHGWHRVRQVNTTTVTVETPYSWTDRIPVGKILEFREASS